MKICVRCGIKFARLDKHLKNKEVCEVKFLNVDRDQILNKYTKLYEQYIKMKQKNNKSHCIYCNKLMVSKNLTRHIETIHKNQTNNTNNINNTNNTNNTNMNDTIVISLNNFGNETNIDVNTYSKIFKDALNDINTESENYDINAIIDYFQKLHFDIKENRNFYCDRKNKYGYIYINNRWKTFNKKDIKKLLLENIYKHISKNVDNLQNICKELINENKADNKINILDINKTLLSANNILKFITFLIDNKENNNYIKEWIEIIKRIDILLSDYNKELKEIYKLTQ
jgi:hypothetical protein